MLVGDAKCDNNHRMVGAHCVQRPKPMKILMAATLSFALCACASDSGSRQLIEVGESCAAIGKFIEVTDAPQSNFPYALRQPDTQVRCR